VGYTGAERETNVAFPAGEGSGFGDSEFRRGKHEITKERSINSSNRISYPLAVALERVAFERSVFFVNRNCSGENLKK
jgi:hypothetical protein